jgi:hypothetical protein
MAVKPWESLRFVSKVEIVPAPGKKGVIVSLEEDNEYVEWGMGIRGSIISQDRRLRLTDETVNFHFDYPDDFKKLTVHFHGDKARAYNAYQSLQCRVSDDWEDTYDEDDDD